MVRLCGDEDAEIRYYAFYAITEEVVGMNGRTLIELSERLRQDPDEQIRRMAAGRRNT